MHPARQLWESGTAESRNNLLRRNDFSFCVVTNRAFIVTYTTPSVATNRRGIFYENQASITGILTGDRSQKVYTKPTPKPRRVWECIGNKPQNNLWQEFICMLSLHYLHSMGQHRIQASHPLPFTKKKNPLSNRMSQPRT